jgi:Uma2 family endonuclease
MPAGQQTFCRVNGPRRWIPRGSRCPEAPDIAVGIISPGERSAEIQHKLETYVRYGTREFWQVYPKSRSVVAYGPKKAAIILSPCQKLTAPLLPDFTLDLSALLLRRQRDLVHSLD